MLKLPDEMICSVLWKGSPPSEETLIQFSLLGLLSFGFSPYSLSLLASLLPLHSSPQHPSPISFFIAPILYPLSSWHFPCVALIIQQLRSMRFPQEQKCCTSAASEQHQSSFAVTPSDTFRKDDRLLHLLILSSKTVEMT